MKTEIHLW